MENSTLKTLFLYQTLAENQIHVNQTLLVINTLIICIIKLHPIYQSRIKKYRILNIEFRSSFTT
jgi:hypothetical protein